MRIYLDLDSRKLMSSPIRALSKLEFKRRDNDTIELQFLRDGTVQEISEGTTARIGIKVNADYDSDFLALTTLTKSGTGSEAVYGGELNLNTVPLATAFSGEPPTFAAMLEVEWTTGTAVSSSQTLPVTILNDVIRGDEGEPATLPLFYASETSDFKATQEQAEAGADNATWMTPLRTAQAISALGGSGGGGGGSSAWNDITDKPSTFAPSPHTHPLSELTQSGATSGQVATFDGTEWVPQDAVGGVTSYNDLTDVPSTFAPSTHSHAAADISSGTLAIARIPTGTTSSTVALGNHTHAGMLTATGGITTIAVVATMPATPNATTLYIVTA